MGVSILPWPHQTAFKRTQFAKRKLLFIDNQLLPKSSDTEAIRRMQNEVINEFS
ncbi:hypothetical protein [Shewanella sp. HN-41]|uniref:hypothetical protein n=1 Tax=Shewanella sp. HN-41 TaxID=327275 RepID=UPI00021259F8|nr:hypothetical protein [Shewanella sp. HN-41]EGM71050.1 hypothetical protein SOHN41_00784 [Shewanella sp. HN-41]